MPRLPDPAFAPDCAIAVDGRRVPARSGESVAEALLAAGRPLLARSPKYHRPRGPYCLSGSCGTCLVRVDGQPSRRACRAPCRDGLRVETQNAWPSARRDLLGAIDFLAPGGIDPHHLLTRPALANRLAVRLARALSGVARLPDAPPAPWPAVREESFEALAIGGGPAGLGAAEALSAAGRRVLLLEQAPRLGGRLRCRYRLSGDPDPEWPEAVSAAVRQAAGEVALGASAVGLWRDGGSFLCAALGESPPGLRLLRAPRVVLCPGGTSPLPPFQGNDLPGVFAGRGLATSLAERGVVPGESALVLGSGPEAEALAAHLREAGMRADVARLPIRSCWGRARLRGARLEDGSRVDCDTVAVASAPAPSCELGRQAGAAVAFLPELSAFALRCGPDGAAGVPGLWVAGEVAGAAGAAEAAEAGRRAGEAAGG